MWIAIFSIALSLGISSSVVVWANVSAKRMVAAQDYYKNEPKYRDGIDYSLPPFGWPAYPANEPSEAPEQLVLRPRVENKRQTEDSLRQGPPKRDAISLNREQGAWVTDRDSGRYPTSGSKATLINDALPAAPEPMVAVEVQQLTAKQKYRRQRRQELARKVATNAMAELNRMKPGVVDRRYGWINLEAIQGVANGNIDPLVFMNYDESLGLYYSLEKKRVNDFANLGLRLFHFTARANRDSVSRLGLLPLSLLRIQGIDPSHISSDSSRAQDRYKHLDHFVHLSLSRKATMAQVVERRINEKLDWYLVSSRVLDSSEAYFCRDYANKWDAERIRTSQMSDLDLICLLVGFERIGYWQVLVKDVIKPLSISRFPAQDRQEKAHAIGQTTALHI